MRTRVSNIGLTSGTYKAVLCISLFLATTSILLFVYDLGYARGYGAGPHGSVMSDFDFLFWLSRVHLAIAAGLITAAVGLWVRRAGGVFLSMVGLAFVAVVYAWWYVQTKAYVRNSEVTQYTKLHDPYYQNIIFHGGTWWDWAVLVVDLLLLIWLAIVMLRAWMGRSQPGKNV